MRTRSRRGTPVGRRTRQENLGPRRASANAAAATSSAYNAGVAAGAAIASAPPGGVYYMGANYAVLPAGCMSTPVQGTSYWLCGNTWFRPLYGANGVYYQVVPTP